MPIPNPLAFSSRPPASSWIAGGKGRRRPRQRYRPDLLALETRALLSTLTVSNDADSGTGSLRAQLAAARAGDTINFAPTAYGTIDLTSGPLQVTASVNIQGPGAKNVAVSGSGLSTVFDVQKGVAATISGLTVTDGYADTPAGLGGGGIANYGSLTLSGDVVTGNVAVSHFPTSGGGPVGNGGGILTEGPLAVVNSSISGNKGLYGGAIGTIGAPVTVVGSTISGNSVNGGGGAIDIAPASSTAPGSVTIVGSTISGNSALGGGGAILSGGPVESAIPGSLTITGSSISGNAAYSGGAIQNFGSPVTIAGSSISGNSARSEGGGIDSLGGALAITGSSISGNSAQITGGLISAANTTLTACTVSGNLGGGIEVYGLPYTSNPIPTLTVAGSTISGNSGAFYGGGIFAFSADVVVSNSLIANNTASTPYPGEVTAGGGIDMFSFLYAPVAGIDSLTITGTTFSGNQAGVGGAIATSGSSYADISVTGSTFVGNTANGAGSAEGGAMSILSPGQVAISNSLFLGNQAVGGPGGDASGGAIALESLGYGATGTVAIQGSTFAGNTAQGGSGGGGASGGAIANDDPGTPLSLSSCVLAGNLAVGGTGGGSAVGGGIDNAAGASLQVGGGSILGNSAVGGANGGEAEGGGVANSGTAAFTGVLISLNAAEGGSNGGSGYGGGLYIGTGAITTLKNTQVVGNTASTAGNNTYGS